MRKLKTSKKLPVHYNSHLLQYLKFIKKEIKNNDIQLKKDEARWVCYQRILVFLFMLLMSISITMIIFIYKYYAIIFVIVVLFII
jgi:uncharacterized membrane protein